MTTGADLEPSTLVEAYRHGYFPMPADRRSIGWWHPDPRGVIPLESFEPSRSLRRSRRRYRATCDRAFDAVLDACADPRRRGRWIDRRIRAAYTRMHELGWAHSIEVWDDDGALVGGLYGLAIGGLFAGESMFHTATDASKVALVELVDLLRRSGDADRRILDVQWSTEHLASLGAIELDRADYVERLAVAVELDTPEFDVPAPSPLTDSPSPSPSSPPTDGATP